MSEFDTADRLAPWTQAASGDLRTIIFGVIVSVGGLKEFFVLNVADTPHELTETSETGLISIWFPSKIK